MTDDSSSSRLVLAAITVVLTMSFVFALTLLVRRAEQALQRSTTRTLEDYTGYASRLMGAELLRHFSYQRSSILAPVTGSARRAVAAPSLRDVETRADSVFAAYGLLNDPLRGVFCLWLDGGTDETRLNLPPALARHIVDSVRSNIARMPVQTGEQFIMVAEGDAGPITVSYAALVDATGRARAVYGYTYPRARTIAAVAAVVFRDTPLLPSSFTGARWNYDTTAVREGEVGNAGLLDMRVLDRSGKVFWQSESSRGSGPGEYRERAVLSTSGGGVVVEAALLPIGVPQLIPAIVQRTQRWMLVVVVALTLLLATAALWALRSERMSARTRRTEAMQQLALGLRHELNNALASVMLNAELLEESKQVDADDRERISAILEQSARMSGVLRRLEKQERFEVMVPYLDAGMMVDLSTPTNEHEESVR